MSTVSEVYRVRSEVMRKGWSLCEASHVGMPDEHTVLQSLSPVAVPQEAGNGKRFAWDAIRYDNNEPAREHDGIVHHGQKGFPRLGITQSFPVIGNVALLLIPSSIKHQFGTISVTYFHYDHTVNVRPHKDEFGDFVMIWVLNRTPGGGASFLTTNDGEEAFRGELPAGAILAFRDDLFWHGCTPLEPGGSRDALIFIHMKGGV